MKYGEKITEIANNSCCSGGAWRLNKWKICFRFRMDPVPGTGNWKRYCVGNRCNVMNEVKQYDDEYKSYVRGKRRPNTLNKLPAFADIDKLKIRGWKRTKKRKQWM